MGANDLVWTADINADPFVQSTNRMRAEAKRVRESVDRDIKQMGDSFMSANSAISQRMTAERAQLELQQRPTANFFSATNSISATYQREDADREQRLAMARKSRADAEAYHQSQLAGAQAGMAALTERQIEAEQRLAMSQKVRADAEKHHEQQRLAMKARMDAAYDQQVAQEQRLAQQKMVQAAADSRMDRHVKLAVENTARQKAISLIFAEVEAEEKLAAARTRSGAAGGAGGAFGASRANRYGLAAQQLAFGIEDAATQYGTMGVAGAMRGASNNISAAAMAFGTKAGIYGAVLSTMTMVGVTLLDMSKKEEEERKAADRNADAQRNLQREYQRRAQLEHDLAQIRNTDTAKKQIEQSDREVKGIQAATREAERQLAVQEKLVANQEKLRPSWWNVVGRSTAWWSGGAGSTKQDQERVKDLRKELFGLRDEQAKAESDFNRKNAEMPKIEERQKADEAEKKRAEDEKSRIQEERKQREDQARAIEREKHEAERYYDDTRTAAEKYAKELERINRLRERKLLDEETAKRAAQKAYETMQAELDKHKLKINIDHPGPYTDARSKEGLDNYYKALMTPYSVTRPEYKDKPPGLTAWEQSQRDAQKHQEDMVSPRGKAEREVQAAREEKDREQKRWETAPWTAEEKQKGWRSSRDDEALEKAVVKLMEAMNKLAALQEKETQKPPEVKQSETVVSF